MDADALRKIGTVAGGGRSGRQGRGACPGMAAWLLFGFLVGSCYLPAEAVSAVMLVCVALLLADPYAASGSPIFLGASCLLAVVLSGALGTPGKLPYDVAKDLWYLVNPMLTLLLGQQLAKRLDGPVPALRAVLGAACAVALVHLSQFARSPEYLAEPLVDLRSQAGAGYLIAALGFGIVLGEKRFRLGVLPAGLAGWLALVLCLASVALSFSRALWAAVLTFALVALLLGRAQAALRVAAVALPLCLAAAFVAPPVLQGSGEETGSFTEKIAYSLQELQVSDYSELSDLNRNWRGFESYRALQSYASGALAERLFGMGLGSKVDLGLTMTLADQEFDSIPILHNGYLYLLVKCGAFGLAAYLGYLCLVLGSGLRLSRLDDREARACGFLLISLALIMLQLTLVITGMFNKSWVYPATLLIGVLTGHLEPYRPRHPRTASDAVNRTTDARYPEHEAIP